MTLFNTRFRRYGFASAALFGAYVIYDHFSKNEGDAWGRTVKRIAHRENPEFLISRMIKLYAKVTGVNQSDLVKPIEEYKNLQDFFSRKVQPREIEKNDNAILAPADSQLLSISKITSNDVMKIKNTDYSLCEFLTDKNGFKFTEKDVEGLKENPQNQLYSLIFYLSPGDYHRFHSPIEMTLQEYQPFHGFKKRVDPSSLENIPVSLIESFGTK